MKTRLPLFFKWGIRFEEVYEVPEQAAREVVYADRLELEEEIVRRSDFDEEDLWRGSVESGKLEEASFLGGKAHGETAKEKQHKAATRRPPLRTCLLYTSAIDLILAVFFFGKLGTAYFDYRKHGQFEWAAPAILFACLVFTLTAPLYIWQILGI